VWVPNVKALIGELPSAYVEPSTWVVNGRFCRKLSSKSRTITQQLNIGKVLRIFAWSCAFSAVIIFSIGSVFARTVDLEPGHAFIAGVLGFMPAALLTLVCFVIQAMDASIEAGCEAALIERIESVTVEEHYPAQNPEVATSTTGEIALPKSLLEEGVSAHIQVLVVKSSSSKPMRDESAGGP
jgi:hypothetical protein